MSFVTFGELMLRLTPGNYAEKIKSAHNFDVDYAGSESNVASSLAILGNKVNYVTKLPNTQIGDAAISSLMSYGIVTDYIKRGGKRLGTYFIEQGSSIRPSSVIYDRANSAISEIKENEFEWEHILTNKKWLFLSGITPVLSRQCAIETIKAARIAKEKGIKVAFDMNYRRSLWKSPSDARKIFDEILKNTDLLFGNSGVLEDVYSITAIGNSDLEKTAKVMEIASEKFGIKNLAFTIRNQESASKNSVSAVFLEDSKQYVSSTFDVEITDRFGTGDAFAAAFLHSLNLEWNSKKAIDFAAAAFALKHTIKGDQHRSSEEEILFIMNGNTKGYVLR